MSGDCKKKPKAPPWLTVLTVAAMLPLAAFPLLLDRPAAGGEAKALLWLYPFYVVASGICALICWRERPELTWILLGLMILSHAAMWML